MHPDFKIKDPGTPGSIDACGHSITRLLSMIEEGDGTISLDLKAAHNIYLLARLGMDALTLEDCRLVGKHGKAMPASLKETREDDAATLTAMANKIKKASAGALEYGPTRAIIPAPKEGQA